MKYDIIENNVSYILPFSLLYKTEQSIKKKERKRKLPEIVIDYLKSCPRITRLQPICK